MHIKYVLRDIILCIALNLLLASQLQTILAQENGSGLDDSNDTEKDNVDTLTCNTNKDCAEYNEGNNVTVYYPFSYCNSGACACIEGRIWVPGKKKEKCIQQF